MNDQKFIFSAFIVFLESTGFLLSEFIQKLWFSIMKKEIDEIAPISIIREILSRQVNDLTVYMHGKTRPFTDVEKLIQVMFILTTAPMMNFLIDIPQNRKENSVRIVGRSGPR